MAETQDPLRDEHLEGEIEMVGDLVVAATGADAPLSQEQIDAVLGVVPSDADDDAATAGAAPVGPDAEADPA